MNKKYIISVSYGEYDDYNKINLAIADNEDTAKLIVESIEEGCHDFIYLFDDLNLSEPIDNCNFYYEELDYLEWGDL